MKIYDYVVDVTADLEPKETFLKYVDPQVMKAWQPQLLRIETEKGILFQQGSEGTLIYTSDSGEMRMSVHVDLCEGHLFDATYSVPGVVNRCINHFMKKEGKLIWRMIVNFKFEHDDIPDKKVFEATTRQSMMQFIDYLNH